MQSRSPARSQTTVIMSWLVVTLFSRLVDSDADPADLTPQSTWQLRDQAAATDRARAVFGAPFDGVRTKSAKLSILEGDRTPFLWGQANGRAVWVVRASDFDLELQLPDGRQGKVLRKTFEICFDAEQGHIVSIATPWPDTESFRLESPEPQAAEVEISRISSSKYVRFVTEPPKISFSEALGIIESKNGMPSSAIQIIGSLVEVSRTGRETKPCWVITFRGVYPRRPTASMKRRGRRFQYRSVLDAQTGKLLFTTSVPPAVVVEKDE